MKKIMFAIALLAVVGNATAQDKVVRKARDLKEEIQNLVANRERSEKETAQMQQKLQQCFEMIEPTFTSPETKKELANAWDIKAQLHKFQFSPLLDNVIAKQPTDTTALAEGIYATLDAMEECYKAVQVLGLKGEKDPYTVPNKADVIRFRQFIAFCGQMFFQNGQYEKAVDAFSRWMRYPQTYTILGADAQALADDEQTPQIAYYTCLVAYFAKDYKTANEFFPQARQYNEEKAQVNQLYMANLLEQGDTAAWLKAGREIVLEDPDANEGVMQNIMAHYLNRAMNEEATSFVDEILAIDESNKFGNYAKGLLLMNAKKYEEAIPFYDKAIETDPEFSDAYYNAGVCWSNHGYDLNEALTGKKMTQAQFNEAVKPVKEAYAKAEPYFLKVQELEPENPHKWASRLSTVYYILENKVKQAEMDKLLE
ncbi:MAG: tetratricopeptide repeat protein [Bacteroidaceae bacterium]|nr:tetratricopeptide repeat protein [Bacteroidaceae bacterium]MBR1800494.1 tetratricopeptide repeat protein [Bacteroidaceae bacterium]